MFVFTILESALPRFPVIPCLYRYEIICYPTALRAIPATVPICSLFVVLCSLFFGLCCLLFVVCCCLLFVVLCLLIAVWLFVV